MLDSICTTAQYWVMNQILRSEWIEEKCVSFSSKTKEKNKCVSNNGS